jgi:hypothetical protein
VVPAQEEERMSKILGSLGILVVLACGASGPDDVVTITADDLVGARRPLVDLTSTVRWIIEGTPAPVDLHRIDARTPAERLRLDECLVRDSNLGDRAVARLGTGHLELEAGGPYGGEGALRGRVGVLAPQCQSNICCSDCSEGTGTCCTWGPRPWDHTW